MAETQTTSSSTTEERPRSEVMNEKLGNFKKFASVSFTRAKQVTKGSDQSDVSQSTELIYTN